MKIASYMVGIMGGTVSTAVPQAQQKIMAVKQESVEVNKVHKLEHKPDAVAQPMMVHAAILPVGGGAVRVPVSSQSGGLF